MSWLSNIPIVGDLWDVGQQIIGGVIANQNQKKAESRQQKYSLEQMAQQSVYNKEQAAYENQLNQQSIDYNAQKYNLSWQRDQMLQAGVNPALAGSSPTQVNTPSAPQASVGGVTSSTPIASAPTSDIANLIGTLGNIDLQKKQGELIDSQKDGQLIDNSFKKEQHELDLNLTNTQIRAQVEGIKFTRQQRKESKSRILKLDSDMQLVAEQINIAKDEHSKNKIDLVHYEKQVQQNLEEQVTRIARNKVESQALLGQCRNLLAQYGLIQTQTAQAREDLGHSQVMHGIEQQSGRSSLTKQQGEIRSQNIANDRAEFDLGVAKDWAEFEKSLGSAEKVALILSKVVGSGSK